MARGWDGSSEGRRFAGGRRAGRWAATAAALVGVMAGGCGGGSDPVAMPPDPTTTTTAPAGSGEVAPSLVATTTTPPPTRIVPLAGRRPAQVVHLRSTTTCQAATTAFRKAALAEVSPYGLAWDGGGGGDVAVLASAPAQAGGQAATSGGAAEKSSAAPAADTAVSGTNVQEKGVDEPDVAKTDGKRLVQLVDDELRVFDVSGPTRLAGRLDLGGASSDLFLTGNLVTAFLVERPVAQGAPPGAAAPKAENGLYPNPAREPTRTTAVVVDVSDPAAPKVLRRHTLQGSVVTAREVDGVLRVVLSASERPALVTPAYDEQDPSKVKQREAAARAENRARIARSTAGDWLPAGSSCARTYAPEEAAGWTTTSVVSLDPKDAKPGEPVTVIASASNVYANGKRLYVVSSPSWWRAEPAAADEARGGASKEQVRSQVHAFDLSNPDAAAYLGSGDFSGRTLNQFSLSEHDGALRIASTLDGTPNSGTESRVSVLRLDGKDLVEVGGVGGLGKNERIYAVRFVGPLGYVVTFRQVDPLYVVDLRDPAKPAVLGELKITGYSAYLHPIGDGRLVGVGQEATEEGRRAGAQVSLFDVGDPKRPKKLDGEVLPNTSSSVDYDHHAFLWWGPAGLVAVPVASWNPRSGTQSATIEVFKVSGSSLDRAGSISHPGEVPVERSFVVGDRLLTVSRAGVRTNLLAGLADKGFVSGT